MIKQQTLLFSKLKREAFEYIDNREIIFSKTLSILLLF